MIVLKILRFIVNKLLLLLFSVTLIASMILWIVMSNLGSRDVVKSWIVDSGTYAQLSGAALDLARQEGSEEGRLNNSLAEGPGSDAAAKEESLSQLLEESTLDIDALSAAVDRSLDSAFLQEQAETFIDGMYDWFEGTTEQPEFELSVAEKAPQFVKAVGQELKNQINALPACSAEQAAALLNEGYDVLTAPCKPPELSIDKEIDNFISELEKGEDGQDGVLYATFTGADLLEDNNNLLVDVDGKEYTIPELIDSVRTGQLILLMGVIVLAGLSVASAKHRTNGLSAVGGLTITIGGIMLIASAIAQLSTAAIGQLTESGDEQEVIIAELAQPLVEKMVASFARQGFIIGLVVVVTGIALVALSWFIRTKHAKSHKESPPPDGQVAIANHAPENPTQKLAEPTFVPADKDGSTSVGSRALPHTSKTKPEQLSSKPDINKS